MIISGFFIMYVIVDPHFGLEVGDIFGAHFYHILGVFGSRCMRHSGLARTFFCRETTGDTWEFIDRLEVWRRGQQASLREVDEGKRKDGAARNGAGGKHGKQRSW